MAPHLVLLSFVVAFSLASTEQCVSSAGSSIDLSLHSLKNASGHWIIKVDTRRFTMKENPQELTVNVQQETRDCEGNEIEQLFSMAFVYPSLHDTSMPGAIEPSTTSSTATSTAPSTTTTSTAPSTTTTSTAPSSTTTSTAPTSTTTSTATSTTTTSTAPSSAITSTATSTALSSTTSATRPNSCPHSGYQLFPEFNCYKAFPSKGERKTWSEAREQCNKDRGDLMVMETEREREEVYIPLYNNASYYGVPWVGVHIPDGEDGWMTVKGEPSLGTWWRPGYPWEEADRKCAFADSSGLLGNYDCADRLPFVCEIPL